MTFNENNKAIYLQIADRICDEILTGRFAPGTRLPSVRDRAAEMEVNANTMMRAYDYLQQQEFIFNRRGIGYFVGENAPIAILDSRRRQFFDHEAGYFFERLRIFGVTPEALAADYAAYCRQRTAPLKSSTE